MKNSPSNYFSEKNLLALIQSYGYEFTNLVSGEKCVAIEITKEALELTGHKYSSSLAVEQSGKNDLLILELGDFITSSFEKISASTMAQEYVLSSKINLSPKKGLTLALVEKIFNPTFGAQNQHLPKSINSRPLPTRPVIAPIATITVPEENNLKNKIALTRLAPIEDYSNEKKASQTRL